MSQRKPAAHTLHFKEHPDIKHLGFSRLGLCAPAGPLDVPSVAVWNSPCTGKAAWPTDPTLTAASPWPATPFAPPEQQSRDRAQDQQPRSGSACHCQRCYLPYLLYCQHLPSPISQQGC
ncbi:hypothetical protein AOLI_G00285390 [Acnodon oligacanthus]